MIRLIMLLITFLLLSPSLTLALDSSWLEDLEQAKIIAQQNNKHIFIDFSGSDWCHWCVKMEKEILNTPEFRQFAAENLVLVSVDFPKRKKQSAQQKQRNEELARKYAVRGFPSVAILDSEGELVTMTGYRSGGATNYVEYLKQLLDQ
ncbi:MAG: thioredoxin family protein [Desulfuromonas sp.]|nr:thioredoxin family protein [Desulfuromonas sp.]